ncbi:hypothetical protein [Rubrivivax albus]|uniref:hypothetical protein n=1 Tax=Rubrivivax albus TaxID=2499835 RepID=UPI0018EE7022|nr:hypothetical protein [Rubrivivax albus]
MKKLTTETGVRPAGIVAVLRQQPVQSGGQGRHRRGAALQGRGPQRDHLFSLCGHGHFGTSACRTCMADRLVDQARVEVERAMAASGLPSVPA